MAKKATVADPTADPTEMCHCGKPLHYTDKGQEAYMRAMVKDLGPYVPVAVFGGASYWVQRHYIALHELVASDVPALGFNRVDEE